MALRRLTASTCINETQKNPFYRSIPQYLKLYKFASDSQKLAPFPLHKTGSKFAIHAISEPPRNLATPNREDEESSLSRNWKIKMLYDGDCPLCMREVDILRERNKRYCTIKFVDISSDNYSPQENQGLDYKTVMGRIHAILSDGTVITNVEAFRKLYEHVGLGWIYAITKYEPMATFADAIYDAWAKYRLQITGRPPMEQLMEARKKNKAEVCKDNACKV